MDADWREYKNVAGSKKWGNGLLPILRAIIIFFVDKQRNI